MTKTLQVIKWIVFILIVIGSFCFYAVQNYKGFNSDMAIQVLMAEDFSFPHNLYFWGQDRLGSILPMLGFVLVSLGLKALLAIAAAQYTLLFASFVMLQTFLKNFWYKLLLLILILFPHSSFQEQVLPGHPYIGHLFFIAAFIFTFKKTSLALHYRYFATAIFGMMALWSSEIAIANLLVFCIIFYSEIIEKLKDRKTLKWSLAGIFLGLCWVAGAKYTATSDPNYINFMAGPNELKGSIVSVWHYLFEAAIFDSNKPVNSVLLWLFVVLVPVLLLYRKASLNKAARFFFWSAFASFLLVILSKWSAINNYALRYFTMAYLQLLIALIFYIDTKLQKKIVPAGLLSLIVFCTAISGLYLNIHFTMEVDNRLNRDEIIEISEMGSFGVLGSYWNTHSIDAFSEEIVATPYEDAFQRNPDIPPKVISMDSIMIIKNGFRSDLPDTLEQFSHRLIKVSPEQSLNEFQYAFYKSKD